MGLHLLFCRVGLIFAGLPTPAVGLSLACSLGSALDAVNLIVAVGLAQAHIACRFGIYITVGLVWNLLKEL